MLTLYNAQALLGLGKYSDAIDATKSLLRCDTEDKTVREIATALMQRAQAAAKESKVGSVLSSLQAGGSSAHDAKEGLARLVGMLHQGGSSAVDEFVGKGGPAIILNTAPAAP